MKTNKLLCAFCALLTIQTAVFCQEILTAEKFFQTVQDVYGTIEDYEGRINITANKTIMQGNIIYKNPSLLRIDFTQPAEQVICFNRETLTVYIPEFRSVLSQPVKESSSNANIATKQGLVLLKRYYTLAYETGPTPVALEEASTEMVIKMSLVRKTNSEGFKTIKLSISPDTKLIRRIDAVTVNNDAIRFDFLNIKLNQNIAELRFSYTAPQMANTFNNFLLKSDN